MRQNENSYTSSYTSKLPKKSLILPDDSDLLPCCLDTSLSLGWSCIFFFITKKPYFSYSDITAVRKNQWFWQFILVADFFLWILIQWHLCKLSSSCISTLLCDTIVLRLRLLKWQMKLVRYSKFNSYLIFYRKVSTMLNKNFCYVGVSVTSCPMQSSHSNL